MSTEGFFSELKRPGLRTNNVTTFDAKVRNERTYISWSTHEDDLIRSLLSTHFLTHFDIQFDVQT